MIRFIYDFGGGETGVRFRSSGEITSVDLTGFEMIKIENEKLSVDAVTVLQQMQQQKGVQ